MSTKAIIIESDIDVTTGKDSLIILWNKNDSTRDNYFSLPNYIESNAEFYKEKYLEWTSEFAKSKVNNTNLVDYYKINDGLSFFWLTSLGQRNNIVETSQINNAIKLLALEDVLRNYQICEIQVISKSRNLILTLKDFCLRCNIKFITQLPSLNTRNIISILRIPHIFSSFIYLIYFLQIRKLSFVSPNSTTDKSSIIFFDMFINVKKNFKESNSHYWAFLPRVLDKMSIPITWAHFFYKQKTIPNARIAEQISQQLNISDLHKHSIIDSLITFQSIYKAITLYGKIYIRTLLIRKKRKIFSQEHITKFNFYFILKEEFFGSCYGVDGIRNSLYFSLIDNYLSKIAIKKVGFYIQENQPWETILINLWKKYKHGTLIGVPHSTVRFWDLRFFYHNQVYNNKKSYSLPLPDFIAINSPVAENYFLLNKLPSHMLKQVEALRYIHLDRIIQVTPSPKKIENILMCGDFLLETNKKMIACLRDAFRLVNKNISISVKPHPGTPIPLSYFEGLPITIRKEHLPELINEFDLVFTSNISSSAVDIYMLGKPLIQFIDWRYFNMSPLRGVDGIQYASTGTELATIINGEWKMTNVYKKHYFFTNTDLTKWINLIVTNIK